MRHRWIMMRVYSDLPSWIEELLVTVCVLIFLEAKGHLQVNIMFNSISVRGIEKKCSQSRNMVFPFI